MLKRLFLFILPLIACIFTVSAKAPQPDPRPTGEKIGKQYVAEPQMPPSEEVNYVEESELALKMQKLYEDERKEKQKEKAANAKKYDSYGGGITIIAMCIVVGALIVLSILFYIFGHISSWFLSHKKKQTSKALKSAENAPEEIDSTPDTGEVIAAISAALAQHFATDHDMQNTILTIKRMRKAYSPWNSKIYNMRHAPEVSHNHPKLGNR